jgi:hypothetical protein
MNMVTAHVGGQQPPLVLRALIEQAGQNRLAAARIHAVRGLIHQMPLRGNPPRICLDHAAPGKTVLLIDGP